MDSSAACPEWEGHERKHGRNALSWAAMSKTNEAFEHYMGNDADDDLRLVYRQITAILSINQNDNELTIDRSIW
jgi:hypothetical protein